MKTKTDKKNAISLKELARRALVVLLTVSMVTMNSPLAYAAESMGEERVNSVAPEQKTVATPAQQATPTDTSTLTPTVEPTDAQKTEGVVAPAENNGATPEAVPTNTETPAPTESTPAIEVVGTSAALPEGEQEVRLSFENAYIYYKGQAVASPMSSVKVVAGEDFEFAATADDGYKLDAVKATTNGAEKVLAPNASGLYVVSAADVAKGLVVSVTAKADPLATSDTSTRPIEEKRNEKSQFVFEDDSIKVTATLTDPASLPADVTFKVTPITRDSKDAQGNRTYNYDAYMEAANRGLREEDKFTEQNSLLYDVAFLTPKLDDQGKPVAGEFVEVQLSAGEVNLDFQFKKDQLKRSAEAEGSSEVVIKHLPLRDSVRATAESTADATNITAADIVVEQPADQGANVATEQAHLRLDNLSATFFALRGASANNAAPAATQAAPAAMQAEPANNAAPDSTSGTNGQGGDTQNGGAAADPAPAATSSSIPESTNLRDFLTSATINAPKDAQGKYVLLPGQGYDITLSFAERYSNNGSNTLQFPNSDADLTYTLPAGLEAMTDGHQGTFNIVITDRGVTYTIKDNPFSINNGVLKVNFNSSDPNFGQLIASPSVRFSLSFQGKLTEDQEPIVFSDTVSQEVLIDDSRSVKISKTATVNTTNDTISYEVSVRSKGNNTDVVVKDIIDSVAGSILGLVTFSSDTNKNNFTVTSSKSDHNVSGLTPTYSNNGFQLLIPTMSNDELITIKYDAQIDPSKIPNNNGKYVYTSNNGVEAWSHEDGEPKTDNVKTEIDYTPIVSKGNGVVASINGDTQTLNWTIIANDARKVSMAGTTITDTIGETSRSFMKYSGAGINVEVRDGNDNLVRTDSVAWNHLESHSDSSWVYKVPAGDAGMAYKYIITYTTEVNMAGKVSSVTVDNTETSSDGGSSSGFAEVIPTGGTVNVSKKHTKVDYENMRVSWKVTFNVPANGLSEAYIEDMWPNIYSNAAGGWIYEELIENSVRVTGLVAGESYDVTTNSGEHKTTITFRKTTPENETVSGLKETSNGRVVEVTFDTAIDETWYEESATKTYMQTQHTNNIQLHVNNETKPASDSAVVTPPNVEKFGYVFEGTRDVNGVKLPIYRYDVILSNITSDNLEITDNFETSLLEYYDGGQDDAGYVFGGGTWWQGAKAGSKFSHVETDSGIKINTNASCMPHDPNSPTGYYEKYRFSYYLTVKDATALQTIKNRAAQAVDENGNHTGQYKIANSASFKGMTASADVTYGYKGVKKEITNTNANLNTTDPQFKITLNEAGLKLNNGEPLTVTDTFENLIVDVNSIAVTPSGSASWDMSRNTITFVIPDATKVEITYTGRVKIPDSGTQSVTFTNTASMLCYAETISQQVQRTNHGAGSGDLISINVVKYRAGDMTHRLSGAKFRLLDANKNPIKGKNGNPVEFTSDPDGKVLIFGNLAQDEWALVANETYYLEEREAPTGYMLMGGDGMYRFTITDDGTNDYNQYKYFSGDTMTVKDYPGTDVRVRKVWSDGNGNHEADNVVITLQQSINGGDYSNTIRREVEDEDTTTWQDVQGPTTVTLNSGNNWEAVFRGLPLMVPAELNNPSAEDVPVTYRVVETQVNDAAPTGTVSYTGGLIENSGTYEYTVNNSVTTEGALEVSKTVTTEMPGDKTKLFSFVVELKDGSGKPVSGTYDGVNFDAEGKTSFQLKDGDTKRIDKLPADVTYHVTETDGNYTVTYEGDGQNGTIETNKTKHVTVKNARQTGGLTVTKSVTNPNGTDSNAVFAITVHLDQPLTGTYGTPESGMEFTEGTASFDLKNGESRTATGLPAGVHYTVTESTEDKVSYTASGEVTENNKGSITSENQSVTIINTPKRGKLIIDKTVVSDVAADSGQSGQQFTFNVKLTGKNADKVTGTFSGVDFTAGEATVTVVGAASKTIEGLPAGLKYEVTESAVENFELHESSGTNGTITSDGATARFTNRRETGRLTLSKQVDSEFADDLDLDKTKFVFDVKLLNAAGEADANINKAYNVAGSSQKVQFTAGVATVELGHNESVTIEGLPANVSYRVTEAENEAFEQGNTSRQDTITKGAESKAEFKNTRKVGKFNVHKTVTSSTASDMTDRTFNFTVKLYKSNDVSEGNLASSINGTHGDVTFTNGTASFTLGHDGTARIENVPVGLHYVVTETDANADGFVTSASNYSGDVHAVVGNEDVPTAEFVNSKDEGGLIVSKSVESAVGTDLTKDFSFTVSLDDKTINGVYGEMTFENGDAHFTLTNGQNKTAGGLPEGVKYTVTETTDDGFTTTYNGQALGAEGAQPNEGTISKEATRSVEVKNTRKKGKLTVEKVLESELAADDNRLFSFTVTLLDADGNADTSIDGTFSGVTFIDGVGTISDVKQGETKTIEGLPADVRYRVVENDSGYQNIVLTGTSTDAEGTIHADEELTATFTNTRNKGDLEVTKTVDSVLTGDFDADFSFTVTLINNPISGTYGEMTFADGVATFTLKNGETKTATGLPTDVRYTVEETPVTGFKTTKTGDEGTISTTKSTAAFTNRRQVGSLKINKTVRVDDKATNTTLADGTYNFRIQGPGAYSGDGQIRSITITNGTAPDRVMQDMPIGTYTITELTNGLPSNMHLMSTSPQTVTVTDGDTAGIPTAAFTNNLVSASAHMEATKTFANWDDSSTSEFTFKLTSDDGAPMPNGVAAQTIPVTKDAPTATFGEINYTEEGTYKYTIREDVPGNPADGKYQGVQYDTQAHNVTVVVAPKNDNSGDLEAHVTYDGKKSLAITNSYTASGNTHLTASKELTGRAFAEGDTWTFTVTPVGANAQTAPMPEHPEVTINANENANIDFGNITYGLEHAGKTYEYQITETGNVANVENDVAKTVTVTVTNKGDGTLEVKSSADETPVKFTNKYQRKVDLVVTKGLEGRTEWRQGEEYNFKLIPENDWSGEKADQSGVSRDAVTRGDKHEAEFGTFVFTSADAGRYFTYNVREVVPDVPDGESADSVLKGMHYDNYLYTVQYHVTLQNNELNVDTTYSRGEERLEGISVINTYAPKPTTARVEAKKIVSGRRANTDDEFTFDLFIETKENVRQKVQTVTTSRADTATDTYNSETNTDTLSVVFDNVPCTVGGKTADAPHVATYIIKEHIPKGAVEKTAADGTKTYVLDGVTYDATERRVTIRTYDDQNGQLYATVNYENDQQPVFTNRYFGAKANISFDKEFYGANLNEGAFDFTMHATDNQYKERAGTAVVHPDSFVDDGGAHTVKMTNGAFAGNVAKVSVPTITYYEPGEYYYEISEDPKDSTNGVTSDSATIRVKVTVDENANATTEYWLYDGTTATKTTAPTLYNNGLITLSMRSAALRAMSDATSVTSFVPAVHKILKNGVLRSGEFSFAMYEGNDTNGRLLQTATNDANGAIAFDAIEYKPADIGKTFTYTFVENNTGDETIAYDTDVIRLTVTVGRGSDGEVKADANYAKFNVDGTPDTNSPDTFINEYDTIVIHAIKRSREEPYDPLPGAHYGLWMVNPDGEDVYMGLGRNQQQREGSELVSSDNGDLYYDIPLLEGVAYYFLEEWPPPEGHLVDPYPTDYFTLVHDKENGRFRLVYEADADFAKYCPGVTR